MSFRLDWIDKWTVDKYRDVTDTDEQWKLKKRFMLAHCESYPAERLLYWTQIFSNILYQECSYPASIVTEVEKLSRTVFTSDHAILQNRLYRLLVDALKSSDTVTKTHSETSRNTTVCDIEERQQSRDTFVDYASLLTKKDRSSSSKQESETGDWDGFNIPSNKGTCIGKNIVPQNSVLDTAMLTIYDEEGYLHDDDDDEDYYLAPNLESSPSPTHIPPHNRMCHGHNNVEKGSLVSDYDRKNVGEVDDSASRLSNFNSNLSPEEHRQSRNRSPISDYDERSSSRLLDGPFQSRYPVPVHEERRSTRMQNTDIKSTSNVLDRYDGVNPDYFDCESVSSRRQSSSQTNANRQLETLKHIRENTSKIYNADDGNFLSRVLEEDLSGIQYEFSRLRDDKSPERKLISYPILSRLSLDILSKLDSDKNELCKENDDSFTLGLDDKEATSHKTIYNEKKSIGLYKKEDKNTFREQDRDSSRLGHYNRKNESPEWYYDRNKSKKLDDDRNNRRKKDDSTSKSPVSRHDERDSRKSRKQDDTNNRIKRYDSTCKSPVSRHDDRDSRNLDDDRNNRRKKDNSTHKSSVSIHDRRDSSKSRKQDDDRINRIKRDDSTRKSPVSRHDRKIFSRLYDEKSRRTRDSPTNQKDNHCKSREQKSPVSKYDRCSKSKKKHSSHSKRHSNSDSEYDERNSQRKRLESDSESYRDRHSDKKRKEHPEKSIASRQNNPEMSQAEVDLTNHSSSLESKSSSGLRSSINFYQPQPNLYPAEPNFYQPQPNFPHLQPDFIQLQPNSYQPQPIVHQLQPNSYQPQPIFHQLQPNFHQPQPNFYQDQQNYHYNHGSKGLMNWAHPTAQPPQVTLQQQTLIQQHNVTVIDIKNSNNYSACKQKDESVTVLTKIFPSQPNISSSYIPTQAQKTNNQTHPSKTPSSASTLVQKTAGSDKAVSSKPQNSISMVPSTNKPETSSSSITTQKKNTNDEYLPNNRGSAETTQLQKTYVSNESAPCKSSNDNSRVGNNTSNVKADPGGISKVVNLVNQLQVNRIAQLQTILSCGIIPLNFNPPVQGIAPFVPGTSSSNPITKGTIAKVPQVQNNSKKKKKKANTQISSSTFQLQKTNTSIKNLQKPLSSVSVSVASGKPTVTVPPNNNKRKLADALGKAPECIITLDDDNTPSEKVPKLDTNQKLSAPQCIITLDDDDTPSEKVPKLDTNQKLSEEIDWKTVLPKESVKFYTQSKNSKIMPCLKSLEEITMDDIRGRTGPLNSVAIICLAMEHEAKTLKRLNLFMGNVKLEVLPTGPKKPKTNWNCRVIAHYSKRERTQVICEAQAEKKAEAVKAACCRVLWYLQHIYFTFVIKNHGPPEPSDIKSKDFTLLRFCQNGLLHTMPASFLDDENTCTKVPFTTDKDLEFYSAALQKYYQNQCSSEANSIKFLSFSPEISEETTSSLINLAKNLELQVRWKTINKSGLVVYRLTKKLYWNCCKALFDKCKPTSIKFDLLRPHETTVEYEQSYANFIQ